MLACRAPFSKRLPAAGDAASESKRKRNLADGWPIPAAWRHREQRWGGGRVQGAIAFSRMLKTGSSRPFLHKLVDPGTLVNHAAANARRRRDFGTGSVEFGIFQVASCTVEQGETWRVESESPFTFDVGGRAWYRVDRLAGHASNRGKKRHEIKPAHIGLRFLCGFTAQNHFLQTIVSIVRLRCFTHLVYSAYTPP